MSVKATIQVFREPHQKRKFELCKRRHGIAWLSCKVAGTACTASPCSFILFGVLCRLVVVTLVIARSHEGLIVRPTRCWLYRLAWNGWLKVRDKEIMDRC
jgi:hypothetical protein